MGSICGDEETGCARFSDELFIIIELNLKGWCAGERNGEFVIPANTPLESVKGGVSCRENGFEGGMLVGV